MFEITSLAHPTKTHVAKKTYKRADSEMIIADLEHLFYGRIEQVINLAGEIIPEALTLLLGRGVDIEISHYCGKNHDEPFCLVTKVRNRGGLIERIKDPA